MDISSIKANARPVEILHPHTEEKIGLRITVLPESDPKVKKVQREITDRQLGKRKLKLTAAQLEAQSFELLVAATDGWDWYGDADFEGEKPEFTEENVRKVYKKVVFIRDQVKAEFDDRESFYEG
ncbi:MAG: hypothetical protein CMN85_10665 [Spongiibacteraceae bacterium]|nr:hypothetical protein [Spongiibacteraceae bacterium]|tara:strand:+ start:24741 stop:25115 length:375 start_codon:yes stop_codon:yes gene_type:complete